MNILDYTVDELAGILEGQPAYRAKQIYERLLKGERFSEMTALPKELRESLEARLGLPVFKDQGALGISGRHD